MRKFLIICLLLLAGGSCGCSDHRREDEAVLREKIESYTRLLPEGYVRFDMTGLRDVITPNHEARLEHRLDGLKMARRLMESKLKKLEYLGYAFETDKQTKQRTATVRTREVWDVNRIDLESGKTEKEIRGLTYLLDYRFLQVDGRWLIDDVVVLEDRSQPASTSSGPSGPTPPAGGRYRP